MSKRPRTESRVAYPTYTCLRPYVGYYPSFLPNTAKEVADRLKEGPEWIERRFAQPQNVVTTTSNPPPPPPPPPTVIDVDESDECCDTSDVLLPTTQKQLPTSIASTPRVFGNPPWGAGSLYEALMAEVVFAPPEETKIKMWGKDVFIPRKQAAYGEPNSTYSFTGTTVTATPWSEESTPLLWMLKEYVKYHFYPFVRAAARSERPQITDTKVLAEAQANRIFGVLPKVEGIAHTCSSSSSPSDGPCNCVAHISAGTTTTSATTAPNNHDHFPASYVLVNHYADGDEYMGYHSDAEEDLDARYPIVSLTLGGSRPFRFQVTREVATTTIGVSTTTPETATSVTYTIPKGLVCEQQLENGSLCTMNSGCQTRMKHGLPKKKSVFAPRLNLTFRVLKVQKVKK